MKIRSLKRKMIMRFEAGPRPRAKREQTQVTNEQVDACCSLLTKVGLNITKIWIWERGRREKANASIAIGVRMQ